MTPFLVVANTLLDSACIRDLEYFLFRFRHVKMCPHQKRQRKSFSSANSLTDGRKLFPMRNNLYSNIAMVMCNRTKYVKLGYRRDLVKISFEQIIISTVV